MKKSEPYIGHIMSIYSQCKCGGSEIFEGLETSSGDQSFTDRSLEVQPSEPLCLKHQSLEPQCLEDHSLDHTYKLPLFEDRLFGVPSLESQILELFVDEPGQLYTYSKRPHEKVNHDNVSGLEQSANKHQCLVNFYDQQYPTDTFEYQTLRPIENNSNRRMGQYFINKFPLVALLTLGYLAIFSLFVLLHPDSYREQTSEGGIRLVVPPLFPTVSKPTQINHPGFQPPMLSETIHSCQQITLSPSFLTRQKLQIFCDKTSVWSNFTTVRSNSEPFTLESSSPCLDMYIQSNCYDGRQVPNVVHYVWFNKHSLDVYTYLSVISVYKKIQPCLILVHADYPPYGPYWIHLLTLIPNIIHVQTVAPSRIFGRKLGYVQHKSDIARLEILKAYGGIYFDVDQIALKSFDKFRHHQFVMAHESNKNLGNAVIISKKLAPFLDVWYRNYNSYNPKQWGYHSTYLPLELSKKYPELIHIENRTFFDPDLSRMSDLYYGHVEWSKSSAIHLYVRWIKKYFTLNELRTMNTSLGEIARFVMYDSTKICEG